MNYKELLAQREELDRKIAEVREIELAEKITEIRKIVRDYDLKPEQIFPHGKNPTGSNAQTKTVAPKYRDPVSGRTWTGRGIAPNWISGKEREQFLIDK